jgi:hypothetical protein
MKTKKVTSEKTTNEKLDGGVGHLIDLYQRF